MDKKEKHSVIFSGSGENEDLIKLCKNEKSFYIALITPNYVNDAKCLQELETAYATNLRLFAFVQEGTKVPDSIRIMKWEQMKLCATQKEMMIEAGELVKKLVKKK